MIVLLIMGTVACALLGIWWAAAMLFVALLILGIVDAADEIDRRRYARRRADQALLAELDRH